MFSLTFRSSLEFSYDLDESDPAIIWNDLMVTTCLGSLFTSAELTFICGHETILLPINNKFRPIQQKGTSL